MFNRLAVSTFIIALILAAVSCASAQEKPKKLIEWGWDEPDTTFMRQNIQKMEQLPFDGVVFHVNSSKGGSLVWEMWGKRKFDFAEFQRAVDDLKATPFKRLIPKSIDGISRRASGSGWTAIGAGSAGTPMTYPKTSFRPPSSRPVCDWDWRGPMNMSGSTRSSLGGGLMPNSPRSISRP